MLFDTGNDPEIYPEIKKMSPKKRNKNFWVGGTISESVGRGETNNIFILASDRLIFKHLLELLHVSEENYAC